MSRKAILGISIGVILCFAAGISMYFMFFAKEQEKGISIAEEKVTDECVWERRRDRPIRTSQ